MFFFSSAGSLPPSEEFLSLKGLVSEKSLQAIKDMEFTKMTEIQHRTIMPLLAGRYLTQDYIKIIFKIIHEYILEAYWRNFKQSVLHAY